MKPFVCILNCRDVKQHLKNFPDAIHFADRIFSGFDTFTLQDRKYHMVFDGELYNRKELSSDLSYKGFDVTNASIEELILYAYKTWNAGCLTHLNGAFSFIIDDGEETFVTKDHMGLKPIFYARYKNSGLIISNTINAILEDGVIKPVVDTSGILELFALGPSLSENKTLYRDIHALAMGQHMVIKNNNVRMKTFYRPTTKAHMDSLDDTIKQVRYLVEDAILRQKVDAHASFLSGGLDSSIITAICAANDPNWKTYSLDYEGNKENFKGNMYQVSLDDPFIDEMVERYHLDQKEFTITQRALMDELEQALIARNLPGMADVDSSLLWLCKQVKQDHQDIILSGECSDEVFGGYPWFYRDELKDLNYFPWLRSMDERITLLNPTIKHLDYQAYMDEQYKKTIDTVEFLEDDSEEDKRARIHTILCLHWFMQTLVTRQVTMGHAADLNIRAPFADVRIIDYVYNIPWDMKFLHHEEKGLLRRAFEDVLPDDIAHRKKNPFPKTHNPLYTELMKEKMLGIYNDPDTVLHRLFDDKKLKELIESGGSAFKLPWYGQLMSGPQLLAYLYQIDTWSRRYNVSFEL